MALHAAFLRVAETAAWPDERLYAVAPAVSAWSPAQHLEHVCLVAAAVLERLDALRSGGEREDRREHGSPRLAGRAVLMAGRIPRGRGQAPDFSLPAKVPGRSALRELCSRVGRQVTETAAHAASFRGVRGVIRHPLLGWLNAAQWWRFLRVHSEHHLAIVEDIRARAPGVRTQRAEEQAPATDAP